MALPKHRRVVTGLDRDGRSCVIIDSPIAMTSAVGGMAWRTESLPADNSGSADVATTFDFDLIHQCACRLTPFPTCMPPIRSTTSS